MQCTASVTLVLTLNSLFREVIDLNAGNPAKTINYLVKLISKQQKNLMQLKVDKDHLIYFSNFAITICN